MWVLGQPFVQVGGPALGLPNDVVVGDAAQSSLRVVSPARVLVQWGQLVRQRREDVRGGRHDLVVLVPCGRGLQPGLPVLGYTVTRSCALQAVAGYASGTL